MPPTMEDVAKRAGVSKSTVSLALNNKPGISLELQENILQAAEDLEHVTKYFYNHGDDFRIFNFESGADYGDIQLSVDTTQDMKMFDSIIAEMDEPHWTYSLADIL